MKPKDKHTCRHYDLAIVSKLYVVWYIIRNREGMYFRGLRVDGHPHDNKGWAKEDMGAMMIGVSSVLRGNGGDRVGRKVSNKKHECMISDI